MVLDKFAHHFGRVRVGWRGGILYRITPRVSLHRGMLCFWRIIVIWN
jgi:hypothetical protein